MKTWTAHPSFFGGTARVSAALLAVLLPLRAQDQPPSRDEPIPAREPGLPPPKPAPHPVLLFPAPATTGDTPFLGDDLPLFDPGGEMVWWNGNHWDVVDTIVFDRSFDKYLDLPAETTEEERAYQAVLDAIMQKLAPGQATPESIADAFQLLTQAAEFSQDAQMCATLAFQVTSCRKAFAATGQLGTQNTDLEKERKRLEWNALITAKSRPLEFRGSASTVRHDNPELQAIYTQLANINALLKGNQLKYGQAEFRARLEFQALILQLFLQRRFQHVLIGTRFYRNLFTDGDGEIRVGDNSRALFGGHGSLPATLATVDSLASEIMQEARQGMETCRFLLDKSELQGASHVLAQTFAIGQYLPEVRGLDRAQRQRIQAFRQASARLANALAVKDHNQAEKLEAELHAMATDYDGIRARAAVETAQALVPMQIAQAQIAASQGDLPGSFAALEVARDISPFHPALREARDRIFSRADTRDQALQELSRLLDRKDYRAIFQGRERFLAAVAQAPLQAAQLSTVLHHMEGVERSRTQARESEKQGNYPGAWETTELAARSFPDDAELNSMRADLTLHASDFVRALKQAEKQERLQQFGSSLAWYLQALKQYPGSQLATEGVQRVTRQILPDAG